MAPKTRVKSSKASAKAGAKGPNPKQTTESKRRINTHEDEGHCGASVRRLQSGQPTEDDVEMEVAEFLVTEDFRSRWASGPATTSASDVLSAAATMMELKNDPDYSAPDVQKEEGT